MGVSVRVGAVKLLWSRAYWQREDDEDPQDNLAILSIASVLLWLPCGFLPRRARPTRS